MKFYNHFHTFPEGAFPDNPRFGCIPEMLAFINNNNIDKAVAFPPIPTWGPMTAKLLAGMDPNEWLYQNLVEYPNIYCAVLVNPKADNACDVLKRYYDKGFIGVKLHPAVAYMQFRIDDPACDKFYACAAELGIFVLFHTGVHGFRLSDYQPILIDNVVYKHPKLKVIIEHMGTSERFGRGFFDQALAVIANTKNNTYAGLTALAMPHLKEMLADTIREAGADRCIFGADWPAETNKKSCDRYKSELEIIKSLRLTRMQENDIFGGTLSKLIERK